MKNIKLTKLFSYTNADIVLYGHDHTFCVNHNSNRWFINSGALGCPRGKSTATAGILNICDGKISFEHLDVSYNVDIVVKKICELKYPQYKFILKRFYGVDID